MSPKSTLGLLVDCSAQFQTHDFPGSEFVRIFEPKAYPNESVKFDFVFLKSIIQTSLLDFNKIILLTHDKRLSPLFESIEKLLSDPDLKGSVTLIDSSTFGPGLGHIIEDAAAVLVNGTTLELLESRIRTKIHATFAILLTNRLTERLNSSLTMRTGQKNKSQTDQTQILNIDSEAVTFVSTIKNQKHILDELLEFANEFERPRFISLLQSKLPVVDDTRHFHAAFDGLFPTIRFFERKANAMNSRLLGDHFLALSLSETIQLQNDDSAQ
ncbi:MAG TPA: DegV family protein [Bellilinea sp.]|nr:DegV family protein [Bellilinea sp.]